MTQPLTAWSNTVFLILTKLIHIFLFLLFFRVSVWAINLFVLLPLFDPLRILPGPDGKYLQSHFDEIGRPSMSPTIHKAWFEKYGHTFRFHGFGKYDYRLLSFDLRVISHVLTSPVYEKPWQTRNLLGRLIGRGIFSMEGKEHRMQRKIISPAFSDRCIEQMTPVMFQKADELRDRWVNILSGRQREHTATNSEMNQTNCTIDVMHWLSRASFDIIGETGFDYHFHALEGESEPVYLAYRRMFAVFEKGSHFRQLLDLNIPWARKVWPGKSNIVINDCLKTINDTGKMLMESKKQSMGNGQHPSEAYNKDLLNLLIRSNMASDPAKRLTDQELLDQCSTFLFAGTDSVSTAISWALYFLSLDTDIQDRLRKELSESFIRSSKGPRAHTPEEQWEVVKSLPLLDSVVRESLRLCPPVHGTIRVATEDDKIPIFRSIQLRDGTVLDQGDYITIRQGSYIHIPIEGLNHSEELWGSDSQKFDPYRWNDLPPQTRSPAFPGLGNSMTFIFGPHSCLGYKFTIAEMKIFISTSIMNFIFTPAPDAQIQRYNYILTRPFVKGKWKLGPQLPLLVRRVYA